MRLTVIASALAIVAVCGGLWRHSLTKSLPFGAGARATPGNTH
jgi:hypothetical protein